MDKIAQTLTTQTPPGSKAIISDKNKLQEFCQKAGLGLPVYNAFNEGAIHAPKFRATVFVGRVSFRSTNTFSRQKDAEQDVASIALQSMLRKTNDEGSLLIFEDSTFCKSILHEFAVKKNLEFPTYTTSRTQGKLPMFTSTVVLEGGSYIGNPAKSKKEAEQFAARAAIFSYMETESRECLSQIINSKTKLYPARCKVADNIRVRKESDASLSVQEPKKLRLSPASEPTRR